MLLAVAALLLSATSASSSTSSSASSAASSSAFSTSENACELAISRLHEVKWEEVSGDSRARNAALGARVAESCNDGDISSSVGGEDAEKDDSRSRRRLAQTTVTTEAEVADALADAGAVSVYVSLVIGLESELVVTDDVTVSGAGSSSSGIAANGVTRVFNVAAAASLRLEAILVANGTALGDDVADPEGRGGCVTVGAGGVLTAVAVTFRNCAAYIGGAVNAGPGATVTLDATRVLRCSAGYVGGGAQAAGGVLVVKGGSTFSECHSQYAGGAIAMFETVIYGGGAFLSGGALITRCSSHTAGGGYLGSAFGITSLTDSTVANSSVALGGGAVAHLVDASSTYTNTHIARCHATDTHNGYGGALFSFELIKMPSTSIFSAGSSITGCTATRSGGGIFGQAFQSYIFEQGSFVSDCVCTDGEGGGLSPTASVDFTGGSYVTRCSAHHGGAMYMSNLYSTLRMTDAKLTENVAVDGSGGALAVPKNAKVFMLRSEISQNSALAGIGGGIAVSGGQIWLVAGSTIRSNHAFSGGGMAFCSSIHPNYAAGDKVGRLYASGPRCTFVEANLGFQSVYNLYVAIVASSVIRDRDSGAVSDLRGRSMVMEPVIGERTRFELCLAPGRSYEMHLSNTRGANDWQVASAAVYGPLVVSDTADPNNFSVPDMAWATRMATHHEFRIEDGRSDARALFEGNVALGKGGGLSLDSQARAYLSETDFVGNLALGATLSGGAVFVGTGGQLEAQTCSFLNNSAPMGRGGGLHGVADSKVLVRDIVAANNTAQGGGFGYMELALEVDIRESLFLENRVLIKNGVLETALLYREGGALSMLAVKKAHIADSTFQKNSMCFGGDGGALASRDSLVTLRGVVFEENVATRGNGGAVAIFGGDAAFLAAEEAPTCARTDIVVDYTTTTEYCGQYFASTLQLCDNVPNRCSLGRGHANPFVTDRRVEICAGCACAYDDVRYFILTNLKTGEDVAIYDKLRSSVEVKRRGVSDTIRVDSTCLEGDTRYSVTAYDTHGESWWGATLKIQVYDAELGVEEHLLPRGPWRDSASVEFFVAARPPPQPNRMEKNAAPWGGGGGLYWTTSQTEPGGLETVSGGPSNWVGNSALYGNETATEGRTLALSPNNTVFSAVSYEGVSPTFRVTLLDYYKHRVLSDQVTSVIGASFVLNPHDSHDMEMISNMSTAAHDSLHLHERRLEEHERRLEEVGKLDSVEGSVQFTVGGEANYEALSFKSKMDLDLVVYFSAPLVNVYDAEPLFVRVRLPSKPNLVKNKLGPAIRGLMIMLCLLNLAFVALCVRWTRKHQNRLIVRLSQPGFLYLLCLGCVVSTLSSLTPIVVNYRGSFCQLALWLYGLGFTITTATLYVKMEGMKTLVEQSLQIAPSTQSDSSTLVVVKSFALICGGEVALLAVWAFLAPSTYTRACDSRVKGSGLWSGRCTECTARCRYPGSEPFAIALAVYHLGCILAGMRMCYLVRNLPSVMNEGKWVFTGFYSQLQVFVTAVPVLFMVRRDFVRFTLLKSLVICVGDFTTLAMIFIPKMVLVHKYHDFDGGKIASYVSKTITHGTQKDALHELLRVVPRKKQGVMRNDVAKKKQTTDSRHSKKKKKKQYQRLLPGNSSVGSAEPEEYYCYQGGGHTSEVEEEEKESSGPGIGSEPRCLTHPRKQVIASVEDRYSASSPRRQHEKTAPVRRAHQVHLACEQGDISRFETLVESGYCDLNKLRNGWPPVCLAVHENRTEMLEILVRAGADVEKPTHDGRTPLCIASYHGNFFAVRVLLQGGAQVNATDQDGWTPLTIACFNDHYEVAEELINTNKCDVEKSLSQDGRTAAFVAAEQGHSKTLLVLSRLGASLSAPTRDGRTPALAAALNYRHSLEALATILELAPESASKHFAPPTPAENSGEEEDVWNNMSSSRIVKLKKGIFEKAGLKTGELAILKKEKISVSLEDEEWSVTRCHDGAEIEGLKRNELADMLDGRWLLLHVCAALNLPKATLELVLKTFPEAAADADLDQRLPFELLESGCCFSDDRGRMLFDAVKVADTASVWDLLDPATAEASRETPAKWTNMSKKLRSSVMSRRAIRAAALLSKDPELASQPFASKEQWEPREGSIVRLAAGLAERNGLLKGELACVLKVVEKTKCLLRRRLTDNFFSDDTCKRKKVTMQQDTPKKKSELFGFFALSDLRNAYDDSWLPLHAVAALDLPVQALAGVYEANKEAARCRNSDGKLPVDYLSSYGGTPEVAAKLMCCCLEERPDSTSLSALSFGMQRGASLTAITAPALRVLVERAGQDCLRLTLSRLVNDRGADAEHLLCAAASADYLDIAVLLVAEHAATGMIHNACDDDRTARGIGLTSAVPQVRNFFKRLGTHLGRYTPDPAGPLFKSDHCVLLRAWDEETSQNVLLKSMRDLRHLKAELRARFFKSEHDDEEEEESSPSVLEISTSPPSCSLNRNGALFDSQRSSNSSRRSSGGATAGFNTARNEDSQRSSNSSKRSTATRSSSSSSSSEEQRLTTTVEYCSYEAPRIAGVLGWHSTTSSLGDDDDSVMSAVTSHHRRVGAESFAAAAANGGFPHVLVLRVGPTMSSLSHLIQTEPWAESRALRAFGEIVQSVAALHARGFVHASLAPRSILFPCEQTPALLCDLETSSRLDEPLGTLGFRKPPTVYSAPELFSDPCSYDPSADVWSLGVILYELLTQAHLFPRKLTDDTPMINGPQTPTLPEVEENSSKQRIEAFDLVKACLDPDPAKRPTVVEMSMKFTQEHTPEKKKKKKISKHHGRHHNEETPDTPLRRLGDAASSKSLDDTPPKSTRRSGTVASKSLDTPPSATRRLGSAS